MVPEVAIVTLPTQLVVGELVAAPFDRLHMEVPAAWQRFVTSGAGEGRRRAEASFTTREGYVEVVGALWEATELSELSAAHVPPGQVPVVVPTGDYARLVHDGPVTEIADGFARIFAWAEEHGVQLGGRKLDIGYEREGAHELYIDVAATPR